MPVAVGCLQIPLVDFAASPTSDVMMVKMQESLAAGRLSAVVEIWHETFWKLALLFFPLVALVIVEGRDLIVALYTPKYAASVPLFRVWSALILLATLQVDGVLRVFAGTRFILALNLMRLAIVGALIAPSMHYFHLLGPVCVILLATIAFKTAGLIRITKLLQIGMPDLLPWRKTALLAVASSIPAIAAVLVKLPLTMRPLSLLTISSAVYSVVYCALVWRMRLLTPGEQEFIRTWVSAKLLRRSATSGSQVFKTERELCAESPVSSL